MKPDGNQPSSSRREAQPKKSALRPFGSGFEGSITKVHCR